MSASLSIQRESIVTDLPDDTTIQTWVESALKAAQSTGELAVRIVDEVESAALNLQYRGKQGATNVLSFPSALGHDMPAELLAELEELPLGDLVICAPVVLREAAEQGKSVQAHWAHMLVHGVLHLLGYDHVEPVQAQAMEALEIEILQNMGYPDPYEH